MNALAKAIQKITTRRRQKQRDVIREFARLRKAITAKSGKWDGTRLTRQLRDAR